MNATPAMIRKSNPDPSTYRLYPELRDILVQYQQDDEDFVASWFFPLVRVSEESGQYQTFARSDWARVMMAKRMDGNRSAGGGFRTGFQTFLCEPFSVHKKYGERMRRGRRQADLDEAAMKWLAEQSKLSLESDFLDAYFKAGVWGDMTGVTATPDASVGEFLSWADADATPIDDLKRAMRVGKINGGKRFNKAIFTEDVWDVFSQHPNVLGLVNNGQTSGMAQVTPEQVSAYLRLKGGIRIAGAVETTSAQTAESAADADANATYAYVAQSGVLLGHVTSAPSRDEPSAGYHFANTSWLGAANAYGAAVKRWYEEGPDAMFFEISQDRDLKQVAPDLGMFLDDVLVTA